MNKIKEFKVKLTESWEGDRRFVEYFAIKVFAYLLFVLAFILILLIIF